MRRKITFATLAVFFGYVNFASGQLTPADYSPCLGMQCMGEHGPGFETANDAPQVAGPEQLVEQPVAGFYEYGRGTSLGSRAVAYVIPAGQADRIPPSVLDLPVTQALVESGDFMQGTVVIFGPESSLSIRPRTLAMSTRKKGAIHTRPLAIMSAPDQYGCEDNYFCIYDCTFFDCAKLQFGPSYTGTGWHRLGDFGFNDLASSMRNRRDRDSLLAQHWPAGSSTRYCADSHSSDSSFGNNAIGDNQASSFANVPDDIHC